MAVQVLRRSVTVDEYHQMIEAGVLTEDDRVELLEGEIVEMTAMGSPHAACVDRLNRLFSRHAEDDAIVRVQSPIRLTGHSEPEPDIALLRPRSDFYADAHPGPADVLLVVEVAETSATFDRHTKVPLYGRAGIPEAWLVDLADECIEVYSKPTPHGYSETRRYWRGDSLPLRVLPGADLPVEDILR